MPYAWGIILLRSAHLQVLSTLLVQASSSDWNPRSSTYQLRESMHSVCASASLSILLNLYMRWHQKLFWNRKHLQALWSIFPKHLLLQRKAPIFIWILQAIYWARTSKIHFQDLTKHWCAHMALAMPKTNKMTVLAGAWGCTMLQSGSNQECVDIDEVWSEGETKAQGSGVQMRQ